MGGTLFADVDDFFIVRRKGRAEIVAQGGDDSSKSCDLRSDGDLFVG